MQLVMMPLPVARDDRQIARHRLEKKEEPLPVFDTQVVPDKIQNILHFTDVCTLVLA